MATSDVQICNMSLKRIGISKSISSFNDGSLESRLCGEFYAPMRDLVLQMYLWPHAQKYATLVKVADEPNSRWLYAYALPTDCIRVDHILTGNPREQNPPPYDEGNLAGIGRVMFTDWVDPEIKYTMRFEDTVFFPPAFTSALAWRIGMELAPPLSRSDDEIQKATIQFGMEMSIAESVSYQGSQQHKRTDMSEANRAR